jgi:4-amino-4-deoxy-L-arabinose transferase-like glycosyltransferase
MCHFSALILMRGKRTINAKAQSLEGATPENPGRTRGLSRLFKHQIALLLILLTALFLRLWYGLAQDHQSVYENRNGDSAWYLANGYVLVTGRDTDYPVDLSRLPTAPLYLILIGVWQALLSPEAAVVAIRITQAILGVATIYFAYELARKIAGDDGAGLITAGVLALSPAFITEAAQIATETLYIFLVTGGLLAFTSSQVGAGLGPAPTKMLVLSAFLLGLATLTRGVMLGFPVGLALLALLSHGWRAGWKRAAVLLLVYALTISTWTVYNLVRFDRLVIGAEGFAAFLYISASGWESPQQVDEAISEDVGGSVIQEELEDLQAENQARQAEFSSAAVATISADPVGYLQRRIGDLQPHGTAFFPGESLKDAASNWLRDDRTASGLIELTRGDAFWPKLALYLFHFTGLIFGLVGMWQTRQRWRLTLPLIGFIAYTLLVALVTLALPRYLFPAEVFWWVLSGIVISQQLSVFSKMRIHKTI